MEWGGGGGGGGGGMYDRYIINNFTPQQKVLLYLLNRDKNLKEKIVDSAGLEPATLGLYPIALPIELRAQLVRLSCRHSI